MTWQQLCGDTGNGCFNARMIQRKGWGLDDGAWILWFNAPADFSRTRANAYYALGCKGPAGPCGQEMGGSTTGIHLEPLTYRGPSPAVRPWAPFVTWTCQAP